MLNLDWHGLYAESWGADLVPDAYAHPAKMSRGLIRQIYVYMLEQGMIAPGDVVGDPFGGVACGALDAMRNGLHWRGCELEPRFVEMGNQNIGLWLGRYAAHFRGWGTAVLVQGDSRQFAEVVGGLGAVVSSPPFEASIGEKPSSGLLAGSGGRMGASQKGVDGYGTHPGQLGAMPAGDLNAVVSSPPYADAVNASGEGPAPKNAPHSGSHQKSAGSSAIGYGDTPGQLGAMPAGDLDAVVSSPPYADAQQSTDGDFTLQSTAVNPSPRRMDTRRYFPAGQESPGNLAAMPTGDLDGVKYHYAYECGWTGTTRVKTCPACGSVGSVVATSGDIDAAVALDACVSSPPFEASLQSKDPKINADARPGRAMQIADYGDAPGNIGNDTGATFWQASRAIVEQVYLALKPGGYVAWITGDFVRKGQRVEFGKQWMTLCEACGFEPVAWAVAWKTEYNGTQTGIFEDVEKRKDRVSFFRRLANEKNPDAAILNEDVIFMRRLG